MKRIGVATTLFFTLALSLQAFDIDAVAPVGYHPAGINYGTAPYFCNAMAIDQRNWIDADAGWVEIRQSSGQLSPNGYPLYLDPGQVLRTHGIGMEGNYRKSATWPDRDTFYEGQMILTGKGDADIRLTTWQTVFVPEKSNTGETGSKVDGKRVYIIAEDSFPTLEIFSMDTNNSLTDVKCWLPDPSDPQNSSLTNQLFHPFFLDLVDDRDWGWIRFMDFGFVNQNPQQDWADRRPGGYAFQEGVINERGHIKYIDGETGEPVYYPGNDMTGAPYETMVALCNETDKDMWINIPHLATDDFITKLAQLIQYGSDGFDPYTSLQSNPVYPPLNSNLTVYVEFSNEIWSSGSSFPQGNWAQVNADALGIEKSQFNARQFSRAWALFETVMDPDRVHRVAATWAGNSGYTTPFIDEFSNHPPLTPPETIAVTTYFGNGIQNWVHDQGFYSTNNPVIWEDPYWNNSPELEADLNSMFDLWKRYVIAGRGYGGATGYDTVDQPGGFPPFIRELSLARNIPIIAYEGGPSLYTNHIDQSPPEDEGITLFMTEANRRQAFAEIYTIFMNQSFERGLRANVGFTDVSKWGKYGQWGHVEYLGQPKEEAVKYQALMKAFDTFSVIRSIDNPQGAVPQFDTATDLPEAETGIPYSQTISVSGGDGALTVEAIGISLPAGLIYDTNTLTIAGTPTEAGSAYVYLRVIDADNDPAWSTFNFPVVARSTALPATITFEDQVAIYKEGFPLAELERLILGDYAFFCSHAHATNGLAIRDQTIGWPAGWPSKVMHGRSWNYGISVERADREPFDLFSVEVGSTECDRCRITVTHLGGGTSEQIVTIPIVANPLTLFKLDLVSVLLVDFRYFVAETGSVRFGAIDNLKFNQRAEGITYPEWEGSINWGGAESNKLSDAEGDGVVNIWEYATDNDPLTANSAPPTITTGSTNVLINYRRNTQANDLTWRLMVTSNLLGSWNVWPVDGSRVFSEVIDPDVDGDGSAELMRYRILPATEDQSLFFRLAIE